MVVSLIILLVLFLLLLLCDRAVLMAERRHNIKLYAFGYYTQRIVLIAFIVYLCVLITNGIIKLIA